MFFWRFHSSGNYGIHKAQLQLGKEIENCICQSLATSGMMCNKSNIATMSLSCLRSFSCTDLAILGNNTLCRMLWGGTTGGWENAMDYVSLSSILMPGTSCVTMAQWCLWVACWECLASRESNRTREEHQQSLSFPRSELQALLLLFLNSSYRDIL